jgi:hypothetical protein
MRRRRRALSPLAGENWRGGSREHRRCGYPPSLTLPRKGGNEAVFLRDPDYNAPSTALAISAVPLLPPNSIGLMPSA